MSVIRKPFWLEVKQHERLFCWLHYPEEKLKKTAIIIIGAVGPEYSHCFRTIRLLADELAEAGYATLRYDPAGMGNSTGRLEDAGIWNVWLSSPCRLTLLLKSLGFDHVALIGFRSGSLILGEHIKRNPVDSAMFFYPYLQGRAYYRDMQMLDLGLNLYSDSDATIEGGGYPVTEDIKIALAEINLASQPFDQLSNALVIGDGGNIATSKFAQHLVSGGVTVETYAIDGLAAMTRPAALSVAPESAIRALCTWMLKHDTLAEFHVDFAPKLYEPLRTETCTEAVFQLANERSVFGILTSPLNSSANTIVLLVNAGSGHHAGPNRLHVDLARALAEDGVASLRIDLSNLGDSVNVYNRESYHPYPPNAAGDIGDVLNYLEQAFEYKNIVLCGLCSGAHNVFHAALRGRGAHLSKVILINPLTFYWTPGQSILAPEENQSEIDEAYYQGQAYDYRKWLALLVNPAKVISVLKFIMRFVQRKLSRLFSLFSEWLGFGSLDRMNSDLLQLLEAGVHISLITSEGDPGEKIMLANVSRAVGKFKRRGALLCLTIAGADHTFSSRASRKRLVNELVREVTKGGSITQ